MERFATHRSQKGSCGDHFEANWRLDSSDFLQGVVYFSCYCHGHLYFLFIDFDLYS